MLVQEVPVKLVLPQSRTPRSPGLHVSSIIRCLAVEAGILKKEWAEDLSLVDVREINDPVAVLRICIGLAWEEWYIPQVLGQLGVVDHPGEYKLNGVYMSPDGESVDVIITDLLHKCHEVKATYYSTNTVGPQLEGAWMWKTQIKAYCKAMNTRHAMLHALFLCGDYSYPIRPRLKCWDIEFTQQELDLNWDLLLNYAKEKLGGDHAATFHS